MLSSLTHRLGVVVDHSRSVAHLTQCTNGTHTTPISERASMTWLGQGYNGG